MSACTHSGAGHFYTKVPVLLGVMVYALDITDLHVYKENFPADGSQVSYFNKIRWLQQFMPMEIKCIEDWSPFPTHAKNRLMVAVLALLSAMCFSSCISPSDLYEGSAIANLPMASLTA